MEIGVKGELTKYLDTKLDFSPFNQVKIVSKKKKNLKSIPGHNSKVKLKQGNNFICTSDKTA